MQEDRYTVPEDCGLKGLKMWTSSEQETDETDFTLAPFLTFSF